MELHRFINLFYSLEKNLPKFDPIFKNAEILIHYQIGFPSFYAQIFPVKLIVMILPVEKNTPVDLEFLLQQIERLKNYFSFYSLEDFHFCHPRFLNTFDPIKLPVEDRIFITLETTSEISGEMYPV